MSIPQTGHEPADGETFRVTARLLRRFLPGETRAAVLGLCLLAAR